MSLLSDIALDHQARRIRLAQITANRSRVLWGRADVRALDASWAMLAPELTAGVVAAQVTASRQSAPYLNRVAGAAGDQVGRATLEPVAFGGSMLDGRDVGPALFGAVTTTKKAIRSGIAPRLAFESGAAFLGVLVKAAIADAGRAADAALAAGKGYTRYVRVVNPGACSRCAILAGDGSYARAFLRHPACKCTAMPVKDAPEVDGLFSSPEEYFKSLPAAEQDRVFTKAGAESIRLGADPISVVNARRGAYTRPGGVRATGEGTSIRGMFGRSQASFTKGAGDRYRRSLAPRLMPEQILLDAAGDHALALELLRQNGYLR